MLLRLFPLEWPVLPKPMAPRLRVSSPAPGPRRERRRAAATGLYTHDVVSSSSFLLAGVDHRAICNGLPVHTAPTRGGNRELGPRVSVGLEEGVLGFGDIMRLPDSFRNVRARRRVHH